jgi:poly [ADP-ribose] polymerase
MTFTTLTPSGDPLVRRRFQLTNLGGNNNKYYLVETWPMPGGDVFFRATYGRVGAAPQIKERMASEHYVASVIREKLGKGYQEIELHGPSTAPAAIAVQPVTRLAPSVQQLIDYIYAEAGSSIASYLAVDVNALSQAQIAHGRTLLGVAQGHYVAWHTARTRDLWTRLADTVEQYYNAIPTQLPHRIKHEQAVETFCTQFDEQENRLNQLEAALATYKVQQQQPQRSHYDLLGADLALVPVDDDRHKAICTYIAQTSVHGYAVNVRDIFSVTVPDERRVFEANTVGKRRIDLLFHGTGSHNVRHILRSGLICPRTPSHGRMFGHGIYFANQCTKSTNYCSASGPKRPHMLLLADVAIGRPYIARDAMPGCTKAPFFHDSVLGKAGKTMAWGGSLCYDEHVVYNPAQQTLRYLVTFDR